MQTYRVYMCMLDTPLPYTHMPEQAWHMFSCECIHHIWMTLSHYRESYSVHDLVSHIAATRRESLQDFFATGPFENKDMLHKVRRFIKRGIAHPALLPFLWPQVCLSAQYFRIQVSYCCKAHFWHRFKNHADDTWYTVELDVQNLLAYPACRQLAGSTQYPITLSVP